ncbi:MAG TPA: hypothetical protein VEL12_08555 [Candidatus Nitrosopolaris sp.]|nr:hypothetical protein [Candidatus Nitrosopolaris sp.]
MSAPAPLRLRPLEIGDILDETFRIYRRHFWLFAGISVIMAIPTAALTGYSFFTVFSSFLQTINSINPDLNALLPSLVWLAAGYLLSFLLSPFTVAAVIYAACESALGRPVTIWGAVRGVLRRYFAILGYVFILDMMGVLFCLFPLWIWIVVGWVAVLPVMFVENGRLIAAMGRSWRLVEGRWWRTFLILLLVFLLWWLVGRALEGFLFFATQIIGIVASNFLVVAIAQAIAVLVAALVNPVAQIAIVLVYFDLRVRREALDLFQLAQRVSATQPA